MFNQARDLINSGHFGTFSLKRNNKFHLTKAKNKKTYPKYAKSLNLFPERTKLLLF